MPSGYEKSDDYGGPKPGWNALRAIVVLMSIIASVMFAGSQ